MSVSSWPSRPSGFGEPAWDVATLFPNQGTWSEEEYLALDTNHLVEFTDGYLEVLPMPTTTHQLIAAFLYKALDTFVSCHGLGLVLFAALKIRIRPDKHREPDVLFASREHEHFIGERFWTGADLVMEVVSQDDPDRDWVKKRSDYAEAGIPEYWIVDPHRGVIVVLELEAGRYVEHGEFPRGSRATSVLLPGFEVDVTAALAGR
jgi:Uma2 family endonuclease